MGMIERGRDSNWKNKPQKSVMLLDPCGADIRYLETGLEDDSFEDLEHLCAPVIITREHEFKRRAAVTRAEVVCHSSHHTDS